MSCELEIMDVSWVEDGNQCWNVCYVDMEVQKMYRAHGYNERATESQDIPNGATFSPLSERQRDFFCRDPVPRPVFNGLELDEWIEHIKSDSFTIRDVLNMRPGEEIKVVHLDRNLMDTVMHDREGNTLYTATNFFSCSTATYKHSQDMKGTLTFHMRDSDLEIEFEFQVEYDDDCWYPLFDGSLPPRCTQLGYRLHPGNDPKPYTYFPDTTRIGWRGPMVKWEKISDQPDVWWYKM